MNPALRPLLQPRDALRPPSADDTRVGAALSLLAHAGLVVALALGVQWRTEEVVGIDAELWAAVPQRAAPRAAEPPAREETVPAPEPRPQSPSPVVTPEPLREAELAEERDRQARQKARAQRTAANTQPTQAPPKAASKPDARPPVDDSLSRQRAREEQLRRIQAQLGGSGSPTSTGNATREAGPSASYAGRIKGRIKPNIVLLNPVAGNPLAEIELRVAPDGTIISRRLVRASGVAEWDDAVLRAIDRTAVLPRDVDGRVPSTMIISLQPQD